MPQEGGSHPLPFPARASHLAPAPGAGPNPGKNLLPQTCPGREDPAAPRPAGRRFGGAKLSPAPPRAVVDLGFPGTMRPRALAAWGSGLLAGDPPLPHLSGFLALATVAQSVGSVVATQGDAGRPAPGCVARAPPPPRPESLSGWWSPAPFRKIILTAIGSTPSLLIGLGNRGPRLREC